MGVGLSAFSKVGSGSQGLMCTQRRCQSLRESRRGLGAGMRDRLKTGAKPPWAPGDRPLPRALAAAEQEKIRERNMESQKQWIQPGKAAKRQMTRDENHGPE